jgi:hypothetical protein
LKDDPSSVIQCSDGNYIIAWDTYEEPQYSNGQTSLNIIKIDFTGKILWQLRQLRDSLGGTAITKRIIEINNHEYLILCSLIVGGCCPRLAYVIQLQKVRLYRLIKTLLTIPPPADVLDAFNDVARAKSDKEKIKSQAEGYRNDLIPRARGEALELLNTGYSYQSELVNRAKGQAESFLSLLKEYLKAEDVTRRRLFLEMVELVLPEAKKVIIEDSPESQGKTVIIK